MSHKFIRNYNRLFISVLVISGLASFFWSPFSNTVRFTETNVAGGSHLMEIYSRIRYFLGDQFFDSTLAVRGNRFVPIGENSLNYFQNTIPFSPQDLADIQRKLDQLFFQLESKGIKLIVVIPPTENTIYPEYMPSQIPVIGFQSRLEQLIAYEKDHGIFKVMDLRSDILKASSDHQTYFQCGTHWNAFGAFIAYRDIMSSLEKSFPNLKLHSLDEYRFVTIQGDTDLVDMNHLDASACSGIDLEPLFTRQVITENWFTDGPQYYNKYGIPKITTVNADSSLPRLLVYRDSYANYLIPFLSDHFSYAAYLWAYPKDLLYKDIDTEKPDVVIIEYIDIYLQYLLEIPG
jgi:alginate O-acetyltransferase complex protein AlgJ